MSSCLFAFIRKKRKSPRRTIKRQRSLQARKPRYYDEKQYYMNNIGSQHYYSDDVDVAGPKKTEFCQQEELQESLDSYMTKFPLECDDEGDSPDFQQEGECT